jgi:O-antigen/teichoic acid export membrane protein
MAKVEISKRLVLINAASSVAVRVVNVSVLLWLQQYLLKRISPEEYALYPVLGAAIVFLPLLTGVLTSGLGRYIVEAYAKGDERGVTQIVSTMFPLIFAAGLVVLVGGGVFAWYVDHVLTIVPGRVWEARIMMALMVFAFSFNVILSPFSVGFYVRQKFMLSNALEVGRELLRIGLLFALLLGVSTRVLWVVVASVSAQTAWLLVSRTISCRLVPALRFRVSEIRWEMAKELTSFGGWMILGQLAEMIRTALDPLVLNKFATAVDVTSFHLGSLPLSNIQGLSSLVQQPLQPQLTAMHAAGAKDRLQNAYLRGGRYALWASLFVAIPLMVYSRELFQVYLGPKAELYKAAATVMVLLLAIFPVVYGHVMLANTAIATAQVRLLAIWAVVVQMLNLGLTFYFVGVLKMGAVGSALATFLVLTFVWPLLNWPLGLRLAGVSWGRWFRETAFPGFLPAVVGAAACLTLKFLVHPASWLSLGLCAAAGMGSFLAALFLLCLRPVDKYDLRQTVARVFSRHRG